MTIDQVLIGLLVKWSIGDNRVNNKQNRQKKR